MKNYFKKWLILALIGFAVQLHFSTVMAQTLPGTYTTSWAGNTFVPTTSNDWLFVQNWANSMFVDSDGTIYANANWDEGAKEMGVYKDGQCVGKINQHEHADGGAITANATYIWATVHKGKISRFNKTNYAENGTEFTVSSAILRGLAATGTDLYVSDYANNQIKVYSTVNQGQLLRSWSITRPGPLALDASGNVWVLTYDANPWGPGTGACIKAYSSTGALLKTVTLAAGVKAQSMTIDKSNNELLVTDVGTNMQIHIYNNINTTPTFLQSFGNQGGILSGTKGLVAPLKFNVPNLVGVDANHNIIVWCNGNIPDDYKTVDRDGMGTSVESYTRSGVRNWQMLGLHFVDMGSFDPSTNGLDLYTKHEHFTMDYSKPDGQQWTWKGWTVDRETYANSDRRLSNDGGHLAGVMMRRINGNLYMYMNGMNGGGFAFYRFTSGSEIAIPSGQLYGKNQWNDSNGNGQKDTGETTTNTLWQFDMFGNYVDNRGDIWFVYDDIRKHTMTMSNGVPIYNLTPTIIATPAPFNTLRRIEYDSDNDIMYLTGYTPAKPYTNDWKSCGLVMARYNNWSTGNRTAAYTIDLPNMSSVGSNMVSVAVEKDYIFVVGVQTRGKVWVYNSSNGSLAGTLVPGSNVGGVDKTGWCDIVNSIDAFKTSTGEYLVTVEEDFFAKVLIYRWCPTGNCYSPPTIPTAPSGLSATATSSSQINLAWTDNSNNEDGFKIERKTGSGGTYSEIATVGAGVTTYNNTGLTANTQYYYRIRSYNSAGNSSYSNEANATPIECTETDRTNESGATITARGEIGTHEGKEKAFDNNNSTKWLDVTNNTWIQYRFGGGKKYAVSKYTITSANDESSRDPKDWNLAGSNDGTNWTTLDTRFGQTWASRFEKKSFTFTNATAYEYYKLNITANNGAGYTQLAEIEYITIGCGGADTQAPTAPTNLASSSITQTSFTLSWTASTDNVGVTGYEVFAGGVSKGTTTSTSMSVTGLTCNNAYSMTVKARDAAGNWSTASSALSVTTSACSDTQVPTAPTKLASSNIGQTSFTLSWTASTDNVGVTGYEVFAGSISKGTTTSTSMSITGLTCGTANSMTVKARDAAGNWSAASSALSVTTSTCSSESHTIKLEVISGWNWVQSFKYLNNGTWTTVNYNSSAIQHNFGVHSGGWLESSTAGKYAQLTFTGTAVQLIAKKESYGGTGKIYIDGVYQQNVSFNGAAASNVLIYEKTGLTGSARIAQPSSELNDVKSSPEISMKDVLIFPNPLGSGNDLTIDKVEGNYSLSIFNANGKLSYHKVGYSEGSITIQHLNLPRGIYIISILSEKDKKIKKLLVK
jgi:chitodextrinase